MGFSWTKEQQQVISLRNRNILVSAAAGSGKTAVLVERIIGLITDDVHPVDIDELLIVTFTNAAAAEMRERIRTAIEAKVEEQPEHAHLLRQLTLVHHAQITTIHSFCLHVIRNDFHRIDLDPSFRIGDEGELKLLRQEVVADLLERHYANPEEGFLNFVDTFATGKDDGGIGELILRCDTFSRSYPWPKEWLAACRDAYALTDIAELEQAEWMQFLTVQMRLELAELLGMAQRMQAICEEPNGPAYLLPAILGDVQRLEEACEGQDFAQAQEKVLQMTFDRMPRKKKTDICDEQKTEQVKAIRDGIKKSISRLQKQDCSATPEQVLQQLHEAAPAVNCITRLTEEFADAYAAEKKKRNLVDFNDLEHFALEILTDRVDGKVVRTEAAVRYGQHFAEIMIDEYQDSNLVQEVVLNAVSKVEDGQPNVFMVGDVKQSIYRFRLARPELFMEKYHTYTTEDSLYQKIELHQNFRSRASVLEGVNFLFYRIMQNQLGGIAYTEETALHPGLPFAPSEEQVGGSVELLLLDLSGEEEETEGTDLLSVDEADQQEEAGSKEWEARLVGSRILELIDPAHPQYVWDKEAKAYRPAEYRDIVILLRSLSGWAEVFTEILPDMGIPAYAESRSGYFTTTEVGTVLHFLRIIDNPMQDIPLAAVLHSPFYGFTSEELAEIVAVYPREMGGGLYGALLFYREHMGVPMEEEDTVIDLSQAEQSGEVVEIYSLSEKVKEFLTELEEYREQAAYMPLHAFLEQVLEQSGYRDYVSLMPGGERRRANLDMLLQKALVYESTSYKGVFHFIRYIEQLQKYSVDFGEAGVTGENENTVRIMSIHKSKGLEFPIVILAGCGKQFNTQDTREKVIFHPEYGLGIDAIHPVRRTKTTALMKRAFGEKIRLENLAEELRVLYVALTRAREKLIMTGTSKKLTDYLQKISMQTEVGEWLLRYGTLSKATSYLDWMLAAVGSVVSLEDAVSYGRQNRMVIPDETGESLLTISCLRCAELLGRRSELAAEEAVSRQAFLDWDDEAVHDPDWAAELERRFSYAYHYDRMYRIHTTLSVSELKRMSAPLPEETLPAAQMYELPFEKTVPEFIQKQLQTEETQQEELEVSEMTSSTTDTGRAPSGSGARRGTLYHLVMEQLIYKEQMTRQEINSQLADMVKQGLLTTEERKCIRSEQVTGFFQTGLYERMYAAFQKGRLHREQQFLIGLTMTELSGLGVHAFEAGGAEEEALPLMDMSRAGGDFAMVQGVIDLYLEEEDGLVLVDYKTDRVDTMQELVKRYRVQLDYYQLALEKMTGKKVKERYLYSFRFSRLLPV